MPQISPEYKPFDQGVLVAGLLPRCFSRGRPPSDVEAFESERILLQHGHDLQ